jgi:voltage-gated potassium channel
VATSRAPYLHSSALHRQPFCCPAPSRNSVSQYIGAAFLIAGSYALSGRKNQFTIAVVLSTVSVVATWLLLTFPQHWTVLVSHSSIIVLVSFFCVSILGYVMGAGKVTADKIFAAVCVYLLIGYGWTFIYALLDELEPGSFSNLVIQSKDFSGRVMQLRYFSFMTLTTVGYGDLVPRSSIARTMSALAAITGPDLSHRPCRSSRRFVHCART